MSGVLYIAKGDPEKWVALCRSMLERWPNAHTYALARLVMALTVAGHVEEAMKISDGLIAERADNPHVAALAFLAYGYARRDTDPAAAFGALRQGLIIARESGNRQMESNVAVSLSRLAANGGNHMEVFDNLVPAIRTHHDSGSFSLLPQPLAVLATALDQLGRYEPAATISRFAATAFTKRAFPEIGSTIDHLREVLGDEAYEALASTGASMTNAAMTVGEGGEGGPGAALGVGEDLLHPGAEAVEAVAPGELGQAFGADPVRRPLGAKVGEPLLGAAHLGGDVAELVHAGRHRRDHDALVREAARRPASRPGSDRRCRRGGRGRRRSRGAPRRRRPARRA